MNRFAKLVLVIALILIPTIVLYVVSVQTQNDDLVLLGIVIGAVLAGLAAFKDILELVDRFTGRSQPQPPQDPQLTYTNVQQTGRDTYGPIQAQHATITQTFNFPSSPPLPRSPAPLPLEHPARATHFTGREEELAQLLSELQPGRSRPRIHGRHRHQERRKGRLRHLEGWPAHHHL